MELRTISYKQHHSLSVFATYVQMNCRSFWNDKLIVFDEPNVSIAIVNYAQTVYMFRLKSYQILILYILTIVDISAYINFELLKRQHLYKKKTVFQI